MSRNLRCLALGKGSSAMYRLAQLQFKFAQTSASDTHLLPLHMSICGVL